MHSHEIRQRKKHADPLANKLVLWYNDWYKRKLGSCAGLSIDSIVRGGKESCRPKVTAQVLTVPVHPALSPVPAAHLVLFGTSSSGRPSSHSGTSHTGSAPKTGMASQSRHGPRPRINQPIGFVISAGRRPVYHYARRHDYVYYPVTWTDSDTGMHYERGYYDEIGRRYDSVAFKKNGRYENVRCHCPYCEQDTVISMESDSPMQKELACPHCGGMMEIQSALDEYTEAGSRSGYASKRENRTLKWVILALAILLSIFSIRLSLQKKEPALPDVQPISVVDTNSNPQQLALLGGELHLVRHSDGTYGILNDPIREYDKVLEYEAESGNYYDKETDCWLWQNTDVTPAVWQYWFEGISSDYGDYGWMEWDNSEKTWYIEASEGNLIALPAKYDTGRLWHISSQ